MPSLEEENASLRAHLDLLNFENAALQKHLESTAAELNEYRRIHGPLPPPPPADPSPRALTPQLYLRYGRQMLLPELGLPGQHTLSTSRVLLIGLGGLGSPAALYLAGAGIGTLGLLDHDTVELSNLHRQPLHTTPRVGLTKAQSAYLTLHERNPEICYRVHETAFTPDNAEEIVKDYDLVLDCTDHPAVRYLISDTCAALGKRLVSAAALRGDGQLVVLNNPPGKGPCYRCLWPVVPRADEVTSCSEGGVLGPAVGVMGVMMAVEAIKTLLGRATDRMLVFSAWGEVGWRCVRMRGRRKGCVGCDPDAPGEAKADRSKDYERVCGVPKPWDKRVDVEEARKLRGEGTVVVDTRDETQFGICSLEGSRNVPWDKWEECGEGEVPEGVREMVKSWGEGEGEGKKKKVMVVCRMGNDSQIVARRVEEVLGVEAVDVSGGIVEWARRAPGDGVYEY